MDTGLNRCEFGQEAFLATIDHLGIAVKSIAAARRFYEALGLSVVQEEEIPEEHVRTAMIPVGESRIELLEATSDDSGVFWPGGVRACITSLCMWTISPAPWNR